MESKSKLATFIGFAVRTGRYKIGVNAVATLKKANLMIVCDSASENTKKESEKLSKKLRVPLYQTVECTLEELVHRENAKVMAITDKDLAKAVTDNCEKYLIARNLGDKNG